MLPCPNWLANTSVANLRRRKKTISEMKEQAFEPWASAECAATVGSSWPTGSPYFKVLALAGVATGEAHLARAASNTFSVSIASWFSSLTKRKCSWNKGATAQMNQLHRLSLNNRHNQWNQGTMAWIFSARACCSISFSHSCQEGEKKQYTKLGGNKLITVGTTWLTSKHERQVLFSFCPARIYHILCGPELSKTWIFLKETFARPAANKTSNQQREAWTTHFFLDLPYARATECGHTVWEIWNNVIVMSETNKITSYKYSSVQRSSSTDVH